jgi:hypothetical protein
VGSRASLLVLSVVAAGLAAAWLLGGGAPAGPTSTRLLPGLDPGRVQRLAWRRPGAPDVVVARGDAGLAIVAPVAAPADDAALSSVLGTLELLSYARRDDGGDPGPTRFTLEVDGVGLEVGSAVPALARTWLTIAGRRYLVDDHAARALDVTLDGLRARDALDADPDRIAAVELHGDGRHLLLDGRPLQVHLPDGGRARADADRSAALVDALDQLAIARFVDGPPPDAPPALTARIVGVAPDQRIEIHGPCPGGGRLAATPVGLGCVPDDAVERLRAALADDFVDRRLVRAPDPSAIEIATAREAFALTRRGALWSFADGRRADAAAVRGWLDALRAIEAPDVRRSDAVVAGVRIAIDGAAVALDPGRRRARRGDEPLVLALPPSDAYAVAARDFLDRALIGEEPLALREARRGNEHIARGATHDDWTGATDLAAVRAFRAALARLRADRFVAAPPAAGIAIEAVFDPPPGSDEPRRYRLRIDRRCTAALDGAPAPFALAADVCDALRRRW